MSTRIRFRVGDSVSGSWVDRAGRRGATAGKKASHELMMLTIDMAR